MRKLMIILFTLGLLVLPAFAAGTETEATNPSRAPGYCGETITWAFDADTGLLTISGEGEMDDFPEGPPWQEHSDFILKVTLEGPITYIGAHSFEDYDNLVDVDFGGSLREMGKRAFYSCDGLKELWLPKTFRVFGEESLRNCTFLKKIHCTGPFPSFRLNCLWDTWVNIYYPVENPWSESLVAELEDAFKGRIEFLASDGSDPYTGETEATTEATTEPVTEVTTEETTAPTTEAATAPTTAPTTEAATGPNEPEQEATQPTAQWTTAPTGPRQEEVPQKSGSWIGLAIVGLIVSGLGIGALVFARPRRKGGRGKYSR